MVELVSYRKSSYLKAWQGLRVLVPFYGAWSCQSLECVDYIEGSGFVVPSLGWQSLNALFTFFLLLFLCCIRVIAGLNRASPASTDAPAIMHLLTVGQTRENEPEDMFTHSRECHGPPDGLDNLGGIMKDKVIHTDQWRPGICIV